MKNLRITPQRTDIIVDGESYYSLGTTNCAFGNIVTLLEDEFPADSYGLGYIAKFFIPSTSDPKKAKIPTRNPKKIWGMFENGSIMYDISNILSNKNEISLTLKDVEEIRIKHSLNINYLPIDKNDLNKGIEVRNVKTIIEVIYSLLYYYAYHKMKLVRCQHCGRWFATTTLKNKYCPRKSTFAGYTHLDCEPAVRNIKQELGRKKKRIYSKMTSYYPNYGNEVINGFLDECAEYSDKIKQCASVDNLSEYWHFLVQYNERNKKTKR